MYYKDQTRYNQLADQLQEGKIIKGQVEKKNKHSQVDGGVQVGAKSKIFSFFSLGAKANAGGKEAKDDEVVSEIEYDVEAIRLKSVYGYMSNIKALDISSIFCKEQSPNLGIIRFVGSICPCVSGVTYAERLIAYHKEERIPWKCKKGKTEVSLIINRDNVETKTIIHDVLMGKKNTLSIECLGTITNIQPNRIQVLPIIITNSI